jgi:hypothetical protein
LLKSTELKPYITFSKFYRHHTEIQVNDITDDNNPPTHLRLGGLDTITLKQPSTQTHHLGNIGIHLSLLGDAKSSTYKSAAPPILRALDTTWKEVGVPVHPNTPHRKKIINPSIISAPTRGTASSSKDKRVSTFQIHFP